MKSTPALCVLVFCWLSGPAFGADSYNIDPAHSTVGFAVTHLVINTVHGKFGEFSGSVTVEGAQLTDAKGVIQTKSIDTGVQMRDKDLRSPNFFDVEKNPTITFQSKKAEKQGDETVLTGEFTMHGVTKEISLPLKLKGPIKDPWGNSRIGLEGKIKLNRKDYGLMYNKTLETGGLVVGDEVEIEINAEGVKSPAK
jgi:polyisoprenoid-binding protein YceI